MEGLFTDLTLATDILDDFITALCFTQNADLRFGAVSFAFRVLVLSRDPD